VMKLEVRGGAGGLVHGANDEGTPAKLGTEKPVENFSQTGSLMKIIQYYNFRQVTGIRFALLS